MRIASIGKIGIYMTKHASERAAQRKVDVAKIAACVIGLGSDKIAELKGEDIIIHAETWKISVVATVKKNAVKIVTVVPKAYTFVSDVDKVRISLA